MENHIMVFRMVTEVLKRVNAGPQSRRALQVVVLPLAFELATSSVVLMHVVPYGGWDRLTIMTDN